MALAGASVAFMAADGKTSTMLEVRRSSGTIVGRVPIVTTFSVGEVAARAGVATSALRFYEANGLIRSERNSSGHRRYRADVLRRVGFIRVAQRVGLPLTEIRTALESLPEAGPRTARTGRSWRRRGSRSSTRRSPCSKR